MKVCDGPAEQPPAAEHLEPSCGPAGSENGAALSVTRRPSSRPGSKSCRASGEKTPCLTSAKTLLAPACARERAFSVGSSSTPIKAGTDCASTLGPTRASRRNVRVPIARSQGATLDRDYRRRFDTTSRRPSLVRPGYPRCLAPRPSIYRMRVRLDARRHPTSEGLSTCAGMPLTFPATSSNSRFWTALVMPRLRLSGGLLFTGHPAAALTRRPAAACPDVRRTARHTALSR